MRASARLFDLLRRTATLPTQELSMCRKCMIQNRPRQPWTSQRQTHFLQAFRSHGAQPRRNNSTSAAIPTAASPLGNLSKSIGIPKQGQASKSSFPETSDKSVAYWLLGSAASVFGIVIFGGLTRLTESGFVVNVWHCPWLY